jgi:TfoX/Sxy family transcriptional regulator of competence genes
MGYDQDLAGRVRSLIQDHKGYSEREMFGGVGFLHHGNMSCGVNASNLIVRVGPDAYEQALSEAHTKEFDMTGRPMRGWIVITPEGVQTEDMLRFWVERGVQFAQSLPPK